MPKTETPVKSQRGGRREGAGRKVPPGSVKKSEGLFIRVEPDLAAWLKSEPGLLYQIIRKAFNERLIV